MSHSRSLEEKNFQEIFVSSSDSGKLDDKTLKSAMFLSNLNAIKSIKIIGHPYTTEKWPPESNYIYTHLVLEITYQNGSKNIETHTKEVALFRYQNYFTQKDIDKFYGKNKFVISPIKAAAIGTGALIGTLGFGGIGFFGGAVAGYVVPKAIEMLSENCTKKSSHKN